ncbi:twin-arginine translocation pathway signal [Trichoderma arundinaceum]|uniref:haloalkane dehalogenase n=1 Tax=Trichoderma arundinaceum TaxID=490622 RepID=A0A395NK35_TRIAR|nr:twin-arginine translocation pathway signal [Trichoderma arundinaceum]
MATNKGLEISAAFPYEKKKVQVLGNHMAYVDIGTSSSGSVVVFLHGNPTSSYLWRNIFPYTAKQSRCIVPDLIGFGDSDKVAGLEYRVRDHQRYIDAFLDAVLPTERITLVLHDWGSTLGFDWASRHEDRIAGLAFMEWVPALGNWDSRPSEFKETFTKFRTSEIGRTMIIEQNFFVEIILPRGVLRGLTEEEMTHYRKPFLTPEDREPTWRFPNEIPIEGHPKEVWEKAQRYTEWLMATDLPKLFFWVKPGVIIQVEDFEMLSQQMKNVKTVFLGPGAHYVQEDYPHSIGQEIVEWMTELKL